MTIAKRALAPRFFLLTAPFSVLISLMSVALGWHYAVDGVAGWVCALGFYLAAKSLLRRSST